jgi:putative addiction module component (TIGR02574 family)
MNSEDAKTRRQDMICCRTQSGHGTGQTMLAVPAEGVTINDGAAQSGGCESDSGVYGSGMILEKFPEVQRLSASEKLVFVSELWNDLEAHPSEVPVSREIIAELDRRMEHFRQHPDEFTTWEAVKGRVLGSRP